MTLILLVGEVEGREEEEEAWAGFDLFGRDAEADSEASAGLLTALLDSAGEEAFEGRPGF